MGELLFIYRKLVVARIRSQLQYRASFVLDLIGSSLIAFIDFVAILIVFHQVPQFGGWSLAEVAFLYGTAAVSLGVGDLCIGQLDTFPATIRDGTFDVALIRPLGTLFQVIASDFALRRLGKIVQSIAILVGALAALDVSWDAGRVVMIPLMMASGTVIFGAIWVVGAAHTFWTIDTMEITNSFTYGGQYLASYPVNIYGVWLRRFVSFFLPLAFVNYFPALYVLRKDDPFGSPHALRFVSPLVAVAAALAARGIWRFAVRHYRSTGS